MISETFNERLRRSSIPVVDKDLRNISLDIDGSNQINFKILHLPEGYPTTISTMCNIFILFSNAKTEAKTKAHDGMVSDFYK